MPQGNPWITIYLPLASTIIVAVATVVLVWLTSRYVRMTGRLVEEAQKSREPSITLDFELPDIYLRLVIENHGLSPAKNICITVLKDMPLIKVGKENNGMAFCTPIKNGISYLSPLRKLKYFVGYLNLDGVSDDKMEISLRVSYDNETGKKYEHVVDFDFGQLRGVMRESFKDPNVLVAEAIKDAERSRQQHEKSGQIFSSLRPHLQKKCSMCAETIPQNAKKCSHCGEMQQSSNST